MFYPFRVAKAQIMELYSYATSVCREVYHLIDNTWSTCTGHIVYVATVSICRKAFLTKYDAHCRLCSTIVADAKSVRASAWHFCRSTKAAVLGLPGQTLRIMCRAVLTFIHLMLTASSCVKTTLQQLLLGVLPDSWTCTFVALHRLTKRFWHQNKSQEC